MLSPFNGFFSNQTAVDKEWLMLDYYSKGEFIYQVYNNFFENIKEEDSPLVYRAITSKNTFKDGILTDGVEIISIQNTSRNGSYQVVRNVKNNQTTSFDIGLFAVHFGEIFRITPIKNGYLFDSYMRNKIKITYTENGRRHDYFDSENKYLSSVIYTYVSLKERDEIFANLTDGPGYLDPFAYLRHNGNLCFQISDGMEQLYQQLNPDDDPDEKLSNTLERFTRNIFVHPHTITTNNIKDLIINRFWFWDDDDSLNLFYSLNHLFCVNYDCGYNYDYSYNYKEGDIKGTYSLVLYDTKDGDITYSDKIEIKNKTADEIATILQTLGEKEENQSIEKD